MLDFDYNIINQKDVLVVSFKGKMGKEIKERLETCRQELIGIDARIYILIFKDVPTIEPSIFREMVLLQQDLRKNNRDLYIVGVNSQLKQYLFEKAVLRQSETKASLDEVLHHLAKSV
jgi:anti-anti-sigma regulatory factor